MSVQDSMNQKYSELCQQLGVLSYQKVTLDAQIADLSAQIKSLNTLAPTMRKFELDLIANHTAKDVAAGENGKEKTKLGVAQTNGSPTAG